MVRKHYVFHGRVQGVGFRITVYQVASRLGLTGWVLCGKTTKHTMCH